MKRTKSPIKSQINLNRRETSPFRTFIALGESVQRGLEKARRPALFLLLILGSAHAGFNIYASVLLQNELAQVRLKGEPLTLAAMAPAPIAESQNAAPLYRQAYEAREVSEHEDEVLWRPFFRAEPKDALTPAQMRAVLERNQTAITLAREAAARPAYRSDIDWTQTPPSQIKLPHYAQMRRLARLLGAHAVFAARVGQNEVALSDVRAIYRMSDHLKTEPMLIGFIMGRALNSIAEAVLAEVLEISPVSVAQAQAFETSLPHTDWDAFLRRGLLSQRACGLGDFDAMRADPEKTYALIMEYGDASSADLRTPLPNSKFRPLMALWSPFFKLDEVRYLRLWRDSLSTLQPLQAPLNVVRPDVDEEEFKAQLPLYAIFTRREFLVFNRLYGHRDALEISRAQLTNALAISAFRQSHQGAYPANLAQAATVWPQPLPLDPCTLQSFHYRSDGQSFRLYSLGRNQSDDGGTNGFDSSETRDSADDMMWGYSWGYRKRP